MSGALPPSTSTTPDTDPVESDSEQAMPGAIPLATLAIPQASYSEIDLEGLPQALGTTLVVSESNHSDPDFRPQSAHYVGWETFMESELGDAQKSFHSGSSTDGPWRLSMVAFLFGALLQMIKVYGMRGIPNTQALVSLYLFSFVIP